MRRLIVLHVLLQLVVAAVFVTASRTAEARWQGPLADYVAKPDASYAWHQRREGQLGGGRYVELILTSQTWRGITWKHQLFLIKPSTCDDDPKHALLFITGGSWKDELDRPSAGEKLPSDAAIFAALAEQLKTPVAVLLQVPRQPMFDGKYEDAIIAYTFDKFFETGDATWPLLLPMVKSAVRAMDAVQEFAKQQWAMQLETFTVTGASKRGWTTWLTGAVDRRAVAIAPMVIDVLNMARHLEYQKEVWGDYSRQISDYTRRRLPEKIGTERGKALLEIVDPYRYRNVLTQPKLMMIGTNDPYWPLDALKLYWDDLAGEKYVLYVPNNGHGLKDLRRVMGSLNALHQHAARGWPLPRLRWKFTPSADGQKLSLMVQSEPRPEAVRFWIAMSDTRDFRHAHWRSRPAAADAQGRYWCELVAPGKGSAAMFGEAVYDGRPLPFFLSTGVRVLSAEGGISPTERQ